MKVRDIVLRLSWFDVLYKYRPRGLRLGYGRCRTYLRSNAFGVHSCRAIAFQRRCISLRRSPFPGRMINPYLQHGSWLAVVGSASLPTMTIPKLAGCGRHAMVCMPTRSVVLPSVPTVEQLSQQRVNKCRATIPRGMVLYLGIHAKRPLSVDGGCFPGFVGKYRVCLLRCFPSQAANEVGPQTNATALAKCVGSPCHFRCCLCFPQAVLCPSELLLLRTSIILYVNSFCRFTVSHVGDPNQTALHVRQIHTSHNRTVR